MNTITIDKMLPARNYFIYAAWVKVLLSEGHKIIKSVLSIVFVFEAFIEEEVLQMLEKWYSVAERSG